MTLRKVQLDATTDGSGAATTLQSLGSAVGLLYAVQLVDGTFDDGVDITLTCEQGSLAIPLLTKADFNTDQMVFPRVLEALNTDGSALTTHAMPIVTGPLKVVIAQGGNAKSGSFIFWIMD